MHMLSPCSIKAPPFLGPGESLSLTLPGASQSSIHPLLRLVGNLRYGRISPHWGGEAGLWRVDSVSKRRGPLLPFGSGGNASGALDDMGAFSIWGTRSEVEEMLPHQMICSNRGMPLPEGQRDLSARRFIKEAPETNRETTKNDDDECG